MRSRGKVTTWLRERGTHGSALTLVSPPPLASSSSHSPVRGPNVDVSSSASRVRQLPDGGNAQVGKLFRRLRARRPIARRPGGRPSRAIQLASVSAKMPAGFAKPVATLARCLLSLMPTEHDSPVSAAMTVRICSATSTGSCDGHARRRPRPSPTPRPDGRGRATGPSPDRTPRRRRPGPTAGTSRRGSGGRRRAAACPRHAELAGLIRGAGDDLARFVRIAVAADDDRQPGQFGVPAQLDRRQELVEVDVQDPAAAQALRSPPAELARQLSHASPSVVAS